MLLSIIIVEIAVFFTKFAKIVAWLIFLGSATKVIIAISVALIDDPEARKLAVEQYLGSSGRTTGQYIDHASLHLLIGLALGTLAEISRSLQEAFRAKLPGKADTPETQYRE